jgi:hypothetical protein
MTDESMTDPTDHEADQVRGWLSGRLPNDWFTGSLDLTIDRDEITIVGTRTAPALADDASQAARAAAVSGAIKQFRENTRDQRIEIAREIEHRLGRKVSWGVRIGETQKMFTTLSVPAMTRLRQADRLVLDTLVDAGVARSRADALAWCVRLVGANAETWLADLRRAMQGVAKVRAEGPTT